MIEPLRNILDADHVKVASYRRYHTSTTSARLIFGLFLASIVVLPFTEEKYEPHMSIHHKQAIRIGLLCSLTLRQLEETVIVAEDPVWDRRCHAIKFFHLRNNSWIRV